MTISTDSAETSGYSEKGITLIPVLIDEDEQPVAIPVMNDVIPNLKLGQTFTLRSFFAARALGGIAMEHFENKPWLVPVYMAPSPIPFAKSIVIYAYIAAATMKSDDPDIIALRSDLIKALREPIDLEKLAEIDPDAVAVCDVTGEADISYISLGGTIKRDMLSAKNRLLGACIKQYPGLMIGLPLMHTAATNSFNERQTPFHVGARAHELENTLILK